MKCISNWDNMIYISIIIIACFLTPEYNFLLKMITIDSFICAIHFLITYFNKNIMESQIVTHTSTLYVGTLLDRYIYYFLQYMFYKVFCNFLWISGANWLYFLMLTVISPSILNIIIRSDIFKVVIKKKEDMMKVIIAKQIANSIKFTSKIYLNKNINVKHKELLPILDDYEKMTDYFGEIFKNTLIILLLVYIKNKCSANLYYIIIKNVVGYKTGGMLESFNTESAKTKLNDIVEMKKWEELLKPDIYKAIFHLYQENNENTDCFREVVSIFRLKIVKMCSLWTLSSFFNCVLIAPSISLLFLLYRNQKCDEHNKYNKHKKHFIYNYSVGESKYEVNYGYNNNCTNKCENKYMKLFRTYSDLQKMWVLILAYVVGYYNNSHFLASFICQFGYIILINKITIDVVKFLLKKCKKKSKEIHINTIKYVPILISSATYVTIFGIVVNNPYITLLLFVNMAYNIISNFNFERELIFSIILISTSLSEFNIFHIMFNTVIIYFAIAFIKKSHINKLIIKINMLSRQIKTTKHEWKKQILNFYHRILETIKKLLYTFYIFKYYGNNHNGSTKLNDSLDDDLIFDIMNIKDFPSKSQILEDDKIFIKKCDKINNAVIDINNQIVIDRYNGMDNSDNSNNSNNSCENIIDDNVFNLEKEIDFIEAISADNKSSSDEFHKFKTENIKIFSESDIDDNKIKRIRTMTVAQKRKPYNIVHNYRPNRSIG